MLNLSCTNCSDDRLTYNSSWTLGIAKEDGDTTTPAPVTDDSDIWPWRVGLFGIGGTCIACVGVVCNITAIVVLAHYRSKSTAPFLLICLEAFDTLLLITEMILETLTYMAEGGVISDTYRDFITPIYW
ncbi:hypothetical protein PoB_005264700 [Plakobranchus ocellatus]|uniref:G-protein coupled receptors family 1 profile domain-containing protein n=1 Tax=Plakobranchus ocellatus TaxID=259542 RepID=A0AAV4C3F4_9GAST|nr:hypothetical protein PoB_005264700 [Plakobranchus ocellatus]